MHVSELLAFRLASMQDLAPLQQLTQLTQLGLEGNPCCNLHPASRFRIELLARLVTSLHQMDSLKVGFVQSHKLHNTTKVMMYMR